MSSPTTIRRARWTDIDPTTHVFDRAVVEAIANECVKPGRDRQSIENEVDRKLIAAYGIWIAGWRWAASEPGSGGLVNAWCCAEHSIFRGGEPSANSIERVIAAVSDWRSVLEMLAATFAELRAANASVEQAASRLLVLVIDRTSAEDAWYATYATVLRWYLESIGVEGGAIKRAIDETIGGRFSSWSAPDEKSASEASAAIALAVEEAATAPHEARDALADWLELRGKPIRHIGADGPRMRVTIDAHRNWIDEVDGSRDESRAGRMRSALDACRASARRRETLTFELLASWQAIVLGVERTEFRTTDAFAKDGRERYSISGDTKTRFDAALRSTNIESVAPAVRAAVAYLDVCFFHPFVDGNARAARLARDHVLTRSGLALLHVEPVFVVARSADDPFGAWNLAYVIDHLAGKSALTD